VSDQVVRWPQHSVSANSARDLPRPRKIDLSKVSDIELVECLRDGEHEALAQLFNRYHRLVLNIAAKIVRDRAEAEDLMQEVFFAIYRVIGRFDPARGTVKNWIVQFAYHKSLNRRRYLTLRGAFDDAQIREFDPPEASYSPHELDANYPHEIVLAVREGLDGLTPKQREVVELVCFQGLLLREVAESTRQTLGNVRHHYYRGIEKLRSVVKGTLEAETNGRSAARGGDK
jgi:RNA polymerase sigma-70 factor (ECF subfamily)